MHIVHTWKHMIHHRCYQSYEHFSTVYLRQIDNLAPLAERLVHLLFLIKNKNQNQLRLLNDWSFFFKQTSKQTRMWACISTFFADHITNFFYTWCDDRHY